MDSNIDASQQRLLDVIYDLFRQRGTWPTFAVVDRKLDQDDLDAEGVLGRLPKGLLRGYASIPLSFALTDDISLTLTGVAAAASSGPDLELLAAFIRWLAERERDHDPEASGTDMTVDSDEALAALGISTDNPMAESLSRRLNGLVDLVPGGWGGKRAANDSSSWSLTVARGIRRYRGVNGSEELIARVVGPRPEGEVVAEPPSATGAPSTTPAPGDYIYDVALSFAGEERPFVDRVAARLKELGVVVFYDQFETVELWGGNLLDRFADVYGRRAKFVVMFVSAAYAEKAWTNEERRQAQAQALKTRRDSVLPVRFDDTQIPGLASTVHYLSASDYTPEELAELIWRKLGSGEPGVPLERSRVASSDSSQAVDSARARPAPGAPPGGSDAAAEHEAWLARHRLKAVAGLAELGKIDFYEVAASIRPELPMPSQRRLSDAVASKNIDTFGWPIGVFIASQPPRPVVEGIITEIRWDERSTYDYWVLSRTGNFYLLKTLSEDPLDAPDKLYFNTRIIRVAETVLFLAGLYQELGSGPGAVVRLDVVHSGIRHRTLSAVGRRRGTFIDRHTIEDQVRTSTAFTIAEVGTRLVEVVKELVGPLFMLYEYLEIDDSVYADLIDKFREGQVT